MYIDHAHKSWMMVTLLLFILATIAYLFAPSGMESGVWSRLLLDVAGLSLGVAVACRLLGKKLRRWEVVGRFASTSGVIVAGSAGLLYLYLCWPILTFGLAGAALMIVAGILPLGKKLARWDIVSLQTLQKGHIWLGLLSLPLAVYHTGFRLGGFLSTVLLVILGAIFVSGILGLIFQYLLVILKYIEGKGAKCNRARTIITVGHKGTLLLHLPLAVGLFVLLAFHAVMRLQF